MPSRPAVTVDKPWGHETIFALVPDRYCGKLLHVNAGERLSLQYHERKDETQMVLTGEGFLEIGAEKLPLQPGRPIHVPAGTVHRLIAVTDLVVVEVSTTELDDVVRLSDDYARVA